jgi:UPF0755 protein
MGPKALKLFTVAVALVALAGAVTIALWTQLQQYLGDPGPADQPVTVVLERGSGTAAIADQLDRAGVIDHPWMFRIALRVLDRDRDLQAGEYAFPAKVTPRGVIGMLSEGETVARRVTIAEGLTVREIFGILERAEGLTGDLPEVPPEGSLLPETYFYAFGDSRRDIVRRMRQAMDETITELWPQRAPGLPFSSPDDALVLASIVGEETAVAGELSEVASVFVNRLERGMRLQSDPTVIYGLTGGDGPLERELTRKDWEHDSRYNTYQIHGLPPTPIANPGRATIAAVLAPAETDYLYFVADGSGGHAFARTLDEHNRNVVTWRRIKNGIQPRPVAPSPPKPEPAS